MLTPPTCFPPSNAINPPIEMAPLPGIIQRPSFPNRVAAVRLKFCLLNGFDCITSWQIQKQNAEKKGSHWGKWSQFNVSNWFIIYIIRSNSKVPWHIYNGAAIAGSLTLLPLATCCILLSSLRQNCCVAIGISIFACEHSIIEGHAAFWQASSSFPVLCLFASFSVVSLLGSVQVLCKRVKAPSQQNTPHWFSTAEKTCRT